MWILSWHLAQYRCAAPCQLETTKRKGALASLIYGTKEGQQMDQEIERSFSQVLARGKYVHSIVMHTVKPDRVADYIKLTGDWYPKVAGTKENHVHLVGSWRTDDGRTAMHWWVQDKFTLSLEFVCNIGIPKLV